MEKTAGYLLSVLSCGCAYFDAAPKAVPDGLTLSGTRFVQCGRPDALVRQIGLDLGAPHRLRVGRLVETDHAAAVGGEIGAHETHPVLVEAPGAAVLDGLDR